MIFKNFIKVIKNLRRAIIMEGKFFNLAVNAEFTNKFYNRLF